MNLLRESLKERGIRITSARIAVLQTLENARGPLDISSIHSLVSKLHVNADQATIYRIIENFTKNSLVNRLQFQGKKFFYEAKKSDHHHAICEKCGRIEDISTCFIDRVEKEIERTKGFRVKNHSLEYFGICKNCQENILHT